MSAATGWENIPENQEEATDILSALPQDLVSKLNTERTELAEKIEKLKNFITTNPIYKTLNRDHVSLLDDQLEAMETYEHVLITRLALLNLENK